MILGRSPALFAGFIAAAINAAVVVFGVPWTAVQIASLNAFALAGIALLANQSATGSFIGRWDDAVASVIPWEPEDDAA